MLIEISQLPFEIQHQILHIDTSTELNIMQDGHVLCTFIPKINNEIEQEKTLFDCFANACPEVADIELELPKGLMSNRPVPFENE